MLPFHRRQVLALLGLSLTGTSSRLLAATSSLTSSALKLGPAHPFSFDTLKAEAKSLAGKPYRKPDAPAAATLGAIDFDKVQKIRFRPGEALWLGTALPYPVSFFHLNKYSVEPVTIFALDGPPEKIVAREILYDPAYFDYADSGIDPASLGKIGFSGFRVNDGQNAQGDWMAFQGASYFRTPGQDDQYGASSRGLALDTALPKPEEFPRFSQFWLGEDGETVTIYALLESPSVTGAYRFDCVRKEGVEMDIHCDLFFRASPERVGIAPLTSMYWYGENQRDRAPDWRPEIHDSDGLSLWTGKGERIWRPLVNPAGVQVNAFADQAPKGFGLMQRDRDFADYQDDGAFYNKRPGLWVEPKGDWGQGAVELVELPTDSEINDNIVAYWRPKNPVKPGDTLGFDYKLYWQDAEPDYPADLAKVIATRIGRAGIPGAATWPANAKKFAIDFEGGTLAAMAPRYDIKPVVTCSSGDASDAYVVKIVGTSHWRALFDVPVAGKSPIELRCFLQLGDKTLSETWLYQYLP
jgi:glucans biosynthesis protein